VHNGLDRLLVTSTVRPSDLSDAGETITVIEASTGEVLSTHKVSTKASPSGEGTQNEATASAPMTRNRIHVRPGSLQEPDALTLNVVVVLVGLRHHPRGSIVDEDLELATFYTW